MFSFLFKLTESATGFDAITKYRFACSVLTDADVLHLWCLCMLDVLFSAHLFQSYFISHGIEASFISYLTYNSPINSSCTVFESVAQCASWMSATIFHFFLHCSAQYSYDHRGFSVITTPFYVGRCEEQMLRTTIMLQHLSNNADTYFSSLTIHCSRMFCYIANGQHSHKKKSIPVRTITTNWEHNEYEKKKGLIFRPKIRRTSTLAICVCCYG